MGIDLNEYKKAEAKYDAERKAKKEKWEADQAAEKRALELLKERKNNPEWKKKQRTASYNKWLKSNRVERQLYQKKWLAKHPDYFKIRNIGGFKGDKYGMSYETYMKMRAEQFDECAICHIKLNEKYNPHIRIRKLQIDHDHINRKHRGLLCMKCNQGLGYFQDSPELLQSAAQYIKEWEYKHNASINI